MPIIRIVMVGSFGISRFLSLFFIEVDSSFIMALMLSSILHIIFAHSFTHKDFIDE
jgi:hypothetical protein